MAKSKVVNSKKVLNALTWIKKKIHGEENKLPSMTEPEQALSMRSLLDAYVRHPSPDGLYDVFDFDLTKMSKLELQGLLQENRDLVDEMRIRYNEQKQQEAYLASKTEPQSEDSNSENLNANDAEAKPKNS